MVGHESCREYKGWCARHPIDAEELISKANKSCKSLYIPMNCTIFRSMQPVQIDGSIKSVDPPCTGQAVSYGEHPYTCVNCAKQLRKLNDTLRQREKGSLGGAQDRIGIQGFNHRYARSFEMESALKMENDCRKEVEWNFADLTRIKLTVTEWERSLMDSCLSCDEEN